MKKCDPNATPPCWEPGPTTERRPIINEWAIELMATWDFTPAIMEHIRDGLSEAYNAGVSSVRGDQLRPIALVKRFIKRRPISFDDSMATSPCENIVEFETWRRTANPAERGGT